MSLLTKPYQRALKLGSLAGRVGASVVGNRTINLFRSKDSKETHKANNLIKNARRAVKTLGSLKGGAMKVGQMLSLHDGLFPPEITKIFSSLQKEAPSVPFDEMHEQIQNELGDKYKNFASIHPEPYAAASIGQVHLGELKDGRKVVIKVQYPKIDKVIRADLKNLKNVLGHLFAMFSSIEWDPIWEELKARLLEELDYSLEAKNIHKMKKLHENIPEIIIPGVIKEASSSRILTMERVDGISPKMACTDIYPQYLKDQWGQVIFENLIRSIFKHRLVHADPNLGNFAFQTDGKVILYDFGCMKQVPDYIHTGLSSMANAVLEDKLENIPYHLINMGMYKGDHQPIPLDMIEPYYNMFKEAFRSEPEYVFGEDQKFYQKLIELGRTNLPRSSDISVPKDIIFIDRTVVGTIGNLRKLFARGSWRKMVEKYVANN
ncbi:protein kinase [Candidatus Magnetomorum sp. HK-1]|nr:protein kinase [Candidatus Magnetomorum sp. HK-1]